MRERSGCEGGMAFQVLAKLRDQVLGRHDVDSRNGIMGRNKRDQPTEICGRGEKVIRRYRTF